MSDPFVGEVRMFGFSYAPLDWAFCDGGLIPVSQNQVLFAVIGSSYGGDGRTTMQLPNMMDRAPIHQGRGPGLSTYPFASKGGYQGIALGEAQLPAHTHGPVTASVDSDVATPGSALYPGFFKGETYYDQTPNNPVLMASGAVSTVGQSMQHENRQPFLAVNFCICLNGFFPSRN